MAIWRRRFYTFPTHSHPGCCPVQPYVIYNSAISVDGKVGKKSEEIVLANRLEENRVAELRGKVDGILVGAETIIEEDPTLQATEVAAKKPVVVIVDGKAQCPRDARVFETDADIVIAVAGDAPKSRVEKLEQVDPERVRVIQSGLHGVALDDLLWTLYREGIKKVLLEGSGRLTKRMLDDNLVAELYVTVAPMVVGRGECILSRDIERSIRLVLEGIQQFGDVVVLHYLVK